MASSLETYSTARTREWWANERWGIGPLCFSLSCSSLLFLRCGGETILSLCGDCFRSPWGGDDLLSRFLFLSSSMRSSAHGWLGARLGPFR